MRPFLRLVLPVLTVLSCTLPLHAQSSAQGSDVIGVVPQSDVSGSLSQSDLVFFQSDEARIRLNDIAARLATALEKGHLGRSVMNGGDPVAVSPSMKGVLHPSSRSQANAGTRQFIETLTTEGLATRDARRLGRSVRGLLDGGTVDPAQLLGALHAYNAAVDSAPARFLADPPAEFLVTRAILTSLLRGSVDV